MPPTRSDTDVRQAYARAVSSRTTTQRPTTGPTAPTYTRTRRDDEEPTFTPTLRPLSSISGNARASGTMTQVPQVPASGTAPVQMRPTYDPAPLLNAIASAFQMANFNPRTGQRPPNTAPPITGPLVNFTNDRLRPTPPLAGPLARYTNDKTYPVTKKGRTDIPVYALYDQPTEETGGGGGYGGYGGRGRGRGGWNNYSNRYSGGGGYNSNDWQRWLNALLARWNYD